MTVPRPPDRMDTMTKEIDRLDVRHVMNRAWMRDGDIIIDGEALMLALLIHTKGAGRNTKDMRDLQKIMKDHNLDPKKV